MSLVKNTISNFIGGVSQQTARNVFPNQLKSCVNMLANPAYGLHKRYPSEHIKKLSDRLSKHPLVHSVNEAYSVFLTGEGIKVYDMQGNSKTVNVTDVGYINTTQPLKDLYATTIGDYTFILNKTVVTGLTADKVINPHKNSALIFLKRGNYATTYTILVNGAVVASHITEGQKQSSVDGGTYSSTTTNDSVKQTTVIIASLASQLQQNLTGWGVTILGNAILLKNPSGAFTIRVQDTNADTDLYCFYEEARAVTDLPESAPNGFIVKIIGDGSDSADDYYIKFKTSDNSDYGVGGWEECSKPDIQYKINKNTMPHALIREADGTFTFKPIDWTDRNAGDEDSIPTPSFIGNTIQEIFAHKGRLAFLSGDKSIYSDVDDIFCFFKSTALAELDTDMIDCGSNSKMVLLKHALPYKGTLLLFSESSIFDVTGGDVFTNGTVSIDLTMEYPCSRYCKPVNIGNNIIFCSDNGKYTRVREVYPSQAGLNARDITEQIPNYISKNVYKITTSADSNTAVFLNTEKRNELDIYNFMYSSDEKVQSAWSKWIFNDTEILGAEFHENLLYLYMQYADGVYLEKIDFTPQNYEDGVNFQFFIDRKCWLTTRTYNALNNTSTFTKPYKSVNPLIVLDTKGFPLEVAEETETTIIVYGDYSKVCVGNCYESFFELPTIYYRTQTQSGTSRVQEGILMLRDVTLTYNRTGFFKVFVAQKYTNSIASEFTFSGVILGTETSQLNRMPISDGVFLIPIISRNEDIDTIKIINDSHLPSCFAALDWLGDFTIRGKN